MDVCLLCLYVVLSCVGRGLCDGPITRPEESYLVSCMCDHRSPEKGPCVPVGNERKMNDERMNKCIISTTKWQFTTILCLYEGSLSLNNTESNHVNYSDDKTVNELLSLLDLVSPYGHMIQSSADNASSFNNYTAKSFAPPFELWQRNVRLTPKSRVVSICTTTFNNIRFCIFVPYHSQCKQGLFPQIALTYWYL
jgi:hypothetical protein